MGENPITYVKARELADERWCPLSYVKIYELSKRGEIPHYRVSHTSNAVRFPLEICRAFFNGEPVAAHWMEGRLNVQPDAA